MSGAEAIAIAYSLTPTYWSYYTFYLCEGLRGKYTKKPTSAPGGGAEMASAAGGLSITSPLTPSGAAELTPVPAPPAPGTLKTPHPDAGVV